MATARAWELEDEAPRRGPARGSGRQSLWREIILPCIRTGALGLLAVAYLLLSARLSALEIQRTDLQKRIDTELARRASLQREYQQLTETDAVKEYAAALGLQAKPHAVQTVSVRTAPPRTSGVTARFERQPNTAATPAPAESSAERALARLAP